ncbi:hypothetical protein [Octadecabacter ascidiaceicola]|uniref:YARHG domain-containing protein n=1 Tax=Octadecabacter ascidiaceicola TaxID=1655543 RepID=A0A238KQH4_9RHOB|nr:hypothetical protein [Octadecabacter ascidiaceicola]SMX44372.1 hypothetical protein OCA8868_03132 [Octadecabacter ascidiaceicola]
MFRLAFILLFLPTFAAADWSPRPSMFSYDATFENCKANPDAENLAASCEGAIANAYVLKRAVAWAAYKCFPESFATCAAPFEEEGLPAIAAWIAVDAGCDATNVLDLPEDEPLPADHCISIASDIMIDEGVVPLNTDISCGIDWIECGDITHINASFWAEQVDEITQDDPEFANDLQSRNREDCAGEAREIGSWAIIMDGLICEAERSAALWSDLAVQSAQDQ